MDTTPETVVSQFCTPLNTKRRRLRYSASISDDDMMSKIDFDCVSLRSWSAAHQLHVH